MSNHVGQKAHRMGRVIAVFGVLIALPVLVVGGWVIARPRLAPFLSSSARDVEMTAHGWNEWQISYQAPGSPTTWYTEVAYQLEAPHWSSPDRVAYGSLTRSYSRAVAFGACELWEWAFLTFDPLQPNVAHITVHRWVAIPWWWRPAESHRL